ncbi:MAG: PQQ-dependent sugar dehydrogenase [Bacteroidota bacterium]
MKKYYLLFTVSLFAISAVSFAQTPITGSRMNEIFLQQNISTSGITTPWEITYGPDDYLWVTDSKAYKVFRIDPVTKVKTQVLDLSETSTLTALRRNFTSAASPWPQGGLAGLAIHPDFMNVSTPKKYVYISYVHTFDSTSVLPNGGSFFTNSIVRFTYNTGTGQLESPLVICDTIPGSVDHNSQRMIIAPVNAVSYLFYAAGDMGAGQLASRGRINHAQDINKYEGKILRFNLEPDTDPGTMNSWIPNDNPYNGAKQSGIWCLGIRNNQGFAYDSVRNILYGSSHGPYSDDEVNIIEPSRNYGHPLVIGYAADENYMGSSAGSNSGSSLALITSEVSAAAAIGASYKDPLFAGYPTTKANINNIFTTNPTNAGWPSEAWSGLGLYNYSAIPGWKNSLLMAGLKWGRIIRTKLDNTGTAIAQIGGQDTVCVFDGPQRYRDMAFGPGGKDIYVTMEGGATGTPYSPSINNPQLLTCNNCIQKFTFLGYNTIAGTSSISQFVPIASGKPNTCEDANTITIDATNKSLWVPITDTSGNIVAEINANGNLLGNVTTSMYTNTGTIREKAYSHALYSDRNITITPQTQPGTAVSIRLYMTNAEYIALRDGVNTLSQPSGVGSITNVAIFKNNDVCGAAMAAAAAAVPTTNQSAFGAGGYVVQANINSFSTFYFANVSATLPVNLVSFKGSITNDIARLKWITEDEHGTKTFTLERSLNSRDFYTVAIIPASNEGGQQVYPYSDSAISKLTSPVIYYRLKIADADGKYSLSSVVTVYPANNKGIITIHPNPVVNDVTVEINAAVGEQANWEVTDIAGKTVLQHAVLLNKGNNVITINLAKIPAGSYYLKVAGNNINQAVKLQKL